MLISSRVNLCFTPTRSAAQSPFSHTFWLQQPSFPSSFSSSPLLFFIRMAALTDQLAVKMEDAPPRVPVQQLKQQRRPYGANLWSVRTRSLSDSQLIASSRPCRRISAAKLLFVLETAKKYEFTESATASLVRLNPPINSAYNSPIRISAFVTSLNSNTAQFRLAAFVPSVATKTGVVKRITKRKFGCISSNE